MRVALVHDYLREYGGAERVVEVLHEIWPEAPLYTSFVDWRSLGIHAKRFRDWDIRTSWAQNWFMRKWHSPLRFLTPLVWKYFDFSEFDVVISSSGWFMSRGITVKKPTVHISYIHHPPRNLYGYATGSLAKYRIVKAYATLINPFLRYYDFKAAQNPDYLIANSKETARRIRKFYRRDSVVIYPPIEIPELRVTSYELRGKKEDYFLSVGRITGAKHVDLIIKTCETLGKNLVVVGSGRDEDRLNSEFRIQNSEYIEFKGSVTDKELYRLYANAKALIFSAEDEDFGMVPVEAMATGTPVIAYRSGGVVETVIDGSTGVFFDELTTDSLSKAIKHFNNLMYQSEKRRKEMSEACIKQASKFSKERFKREMKEFVLKALKNKSFHS